MGFFGWLFLALVLFWLSGIARRHHQKQEAAKFAAIRKLHEEQAATLCRILDEAKAKLPVPAVDELARQVTLDAIQRETRAKSAVVAVLKQTGCTEQQIEDVLKAVDGAEEGDSH